MQPLNCYCAFCTRVLISEFPPCVCLRVWLRRVWMVVCVIKQLWGCALFFLSFIIESSLDDLRTCANDSDSRDD